MSTLMGRCDHCGKSCVDGFLCPTCTRFLGELVRAAPALADDLDLVRARLARYGDFIGRGNDRSPLPINLAAADALQALNRSLRGTADSMGAGTGLQGVRLGIVASWINRNLSGLPRLVSAGWHYEQIDRAFTRGQSICDRPAHSRYAGRCDCGRELYAPDGVTEIECRCGLAWDVEEQRDQMNALLADVVAPGPTIARALSALGVEVTPERIRQWRNRGHLQVQWTDDGPPLTHWYRVGDIQTLLEEKSR